MSVSRSLLTCRAQGALITAVALFAAAQGCKEEPEPEPPLAQEGEACQIERDCEVGLTCRNDLCVQLNVPNLDMDGDMAPDNGDMTTPDADMTPSVMSEDYVISFTKRFNAGADRDKTFLYTVDTATQTVTRVSEDAEVCRFTCWLSRDLTTLVYTRPSSAEPTQIDVYATSVDASLKAAGSGTVIASGVRRVVFDGEAVSFVRGSGTAQTAYRLKLGTTTETVLADLVVRGNDSQDSWLSHDASRRAILFSPTLQRLSIRAGKLDAPITEDDQVYIIDGANYQEVSGAYFGSTIPSAISRDGRYMAVLTDAPNNYGICQTNADCEVMNGQHCGTQGRCTVRELTVHFFDLENAVELPAPGKDGKTCVANTDCSAAHECYIPAPTQLDKARCIPRRVVLGLEGQLRQPRVGEFNRSGCELTATRASSRYTQVNAALSFAPDGNLYLSAARSCTQLSGEGNIPDSDILRITPQGGAVEVVTGNARQRFDDGRCYDDVEQKIDTTDCVIYTAQSLSSPLGNEIAFMGTNPGITDVNQATARLDVWSVRRDGTQRRWLGAGAIFDEVRRIAAHPPRQ